jgi:hypothetical protein
MRHIRSWVTIPRPCVISCSLTSAVLDHDRSAKAFALFEHDGASIGESRISDVYFPKTKLGEVRR